MLAAAQASRLSDEDIAREIAPVELTERLTETTLSSFSSAQGNRTKRILRTLADESAFLDPPPSELTTEAPPSPTEQKAILARAANYAAAYKNSLPDITCTKTERRFNDNPSEDKTNAGVVGRLTDVDPSAWDIQARTNIVGRLRERVDLVSETTVNHADPAASAGFGNLIRSVFLDDGAPQAVWSYWETIDSKRLAAFHYAIDPADSDFPTNSCCVEGQGGWPRDNVAYRGSLLIEPASGVIFRITVQAIDTSPGAVSHGNDAVIEYRSANISGKAWMCPYRAITLSDNTVVLHGFNVPVRTLDVVEFTNYRTAEPAPHAVSPLMGPPEAPQRGRPVTVRQLEQMLTSAHEARRSDNDIAQEIGRVELTERLTEATLSHFSRGERKLVKSMLQILADESAFLDPPPSELPADSPPGVDQQKAIMAQAFVYASAYIHNLPNFLCTQVIHRLDNDPARQKAEAVALLSDEDTAAWRMQSRPAGPGGLTERDTATNELTIRNGTESHRHTGAVSASPFAGGPYAMQGLTTSGEFGGMIGSVFSVKSAAKAAWSHWEMMAGKHAAVFNYSVDLAHSDFFIYWCCIDQERRKERVAYRGAVFIDPDSGGVLRISWQALNISDVIPTRSSDTVVDYRPVEIGGSSWLCPVRSVTKMDSRNLYQVRGANRYVRSLNQVEFTKYHKFGSESKMLAVEVPTTEAGSGVSAAPSVIAEPKPEPKTSSQTAPDSQRTHAPQAKPTAEAGVNAPALVAASTSAPPSPPASPKPMESVGDEQAIFRVRTNVVTVRVAVHGAEGHAMADLRKDDFELFDNGQPQMISSFSVEAPASTDQKPVPVAQATDGSPAAHAAVPPPDRYVMYLVDDLDLEFGDLSQTRSAVERVLRDSPDPASRVGVLTTSGRVVLDFTSDWKKVDEALNRISPQGRAAVHECPNLSYYLADRIVHFEDKQAIALATRKAQACGGAVSGERTAALAAEQAESQYRAQTKAIVAALKDAARRMSILPGSRTIVLVSPGFIAPDLEFELNGATDTAARAGVVINTLDARGVWVLPGFDAATAGLEGPPEDNATRGQNAPGSRVGAPEMNRIDRQYAEQAQQAQSDVLMQLADGTGGSVSHGNDFEAAFRRLMAAPEVSYILGFTPTKLKPDGSFHKLKVTVADRKGLSIQARNGYFAPKHDVDAAEQAKEEIENAVFSRDETQDIPVTLKTQISQGKLSAIAHFGIGGIRFVNKDGHNRSSLTATVSLFDAGGNYLKGVQDVVNLDFADDKLAAASIGRCCEGRLRYSGRQLRGASSSSRQRRAHVGDEQPR